MPTAWSSSCGGRVSARWRSRASNIGGATGRTCGASAPLARHCYSSPAGPPRLASMFLKVSWSPPLHRPRLQRSKLAVYASALPHMAACVSSRRQYSIPRPFPRAPMFSIRPATPRCGSPSIWRRWPHCRSGCAYTRRRCIQRLRPTIWCRSLRLCVLRTRPRAHHSGTASGVRRPSKISPARVVLNFHRGQWC